MLCYLGRKFHASLIIPVNNKRGKKGGQGGQEGKRERATMTTQPQAAWDYTEPRSLAHAHSALCVSIQKADKLGRAG